MRDKKDTHVTLTVEIMRKNEKKSFELLVRARNVLDLQCQKLSNHKWHWLGAYPSTSISTTALINASFKEIL